MMHDAKQLKVSYHHQMKGKASAWRWWYRRQRWEAQYQKCRDTGVSDTRRRLRQKIPASRWA